MKQRILLCLALFMTTACTTTSQPISMSVEAQPTDPSVTNGDVMANRRAAGEDVPARRGSEVVEIRTYEYVIEKAGSRPKKVEKTNVSCQVSGDGFQASVATPAQVRVPDYGYASRPLTVQCTQDGYKPGIANVTAYDATEAGRLNAGSSAGIIGVVGMGIINAASSNKNNNFVYPPVNVVMNRQDCDTSAVKCRSK